MEWDGAGWNGMGWGRMGQDGMGWDGLGWDGMERVGTGQVTPTGIFTEDPYFIILLYHICIIPY